jgi:hypothetical protein
VKNGRGGWWFFFDSVAHRRLHFVTSANFFSLFFLLLPYPYRRWIDKELSLFVANLEAFFWAVDRKQSSSMRVYRQPSRESANSAHLLLVFFTFFFFSYLPVVKTTWLMQYLSLTTTYHGRMACCILIC